MVVPTSNSQADRCDKRDKNDGPLAAGGQGVLQTVASGGGRPGQERAAAASNHRRPALPLGGRRAAGAEQRRGRVAGTTERNLTEYGPVVST